MAKSMTDIINQWLIKADNDLNVAKKELMTESPITDAICFHSQQAVEKYLKLFLISKGIEPWKTHIISDLLIECSGFDIQFESLQDISYLSEYAVELRYPDDFYIPDIDEAREAVTVAEKVKKFVKDRIVI